MTESIRVETISLSSSPTSGGGQIDTPNDQGAAVAGSNSLDTVQRAARIGDSVPIVFGLRVGAGGGVLVSPPATEARFSNDANNDVTASYLLVISEGQITPIQVRDVFQQSCRVGSFTQAYNRRAGTWGPGNFITEQVGFEDQIPEAPIYCGSGTGSYAGMTTGSFINTIPYPFTQWDRQVHLFVRGGMWVPRILSGDTEGPSNNVADLVRWMLRRSSRVPDALIDQTALLYAAQFTESNGLWFNGTIGDPSNLADWISNNVKYFLLRESRRGGKLGLRPLLPFDIATGALDIGPVGWVFTFTEDHVLPGGVEIAYSSRVERMPFCCQMIWRQQPEDGLGLARTAEVRYGGSALAGPFEQHDLSAFCTTEDHAFKVGAYILARRRYIDHRMTITVRTGSFSAVLAPGDIVRVNLQRIASTGADTEHDYLYEVEKVARSVAGDVVIELTHFPVDDQGRSLVALDVSRAQGNGIILPTGRAPVNCDLNSFEDVTFETDFGPWDDWQISIEDPALYDLGSIWPEGVYDFGDGWGAGLDEFESGVDVGAGWTVGANGDGTGFSGTLGGLNAGLVGQPIGTGYTSQVSFSTPFIVYPDVWYKMLDPAFVSVYVDVSVGSPPVGTDLSLLINDGTGPSYNPFLGQFGGGLTGVNVVIPEGETIARIRINGYGDSLATSTDRAFKVISWAGGGYTPSTDPQTGEIITPALDLTNEQPYTVDPYVGAITMGGVGVWTWDSGLTQWVWEGSDLGEWTWNQGTQQWQWAGSNPKWNWNATSQDWDWNGVGSETGEPPESPPYAPSSAPPSGTAYTVTTRAWVDNPPTDDLELLLTDILEDENGNVVDQIDGGTLIISALSMIFGDFKWVPGPQFWSYIGGGGWRWHSTSQQWEWRGDGIDDWQWNDFTDEWSFIGDPPSGWAWDGENGVWNQTDPGAGPEPSGPPSAGPPTSPAAEPPYFSRSSRTGVLVRHVTLS